MRVASSAGCRARSAAGATWTSRTRTAQWAGRSDHTSVVDAAGSIYVIGGSDGTNFNDVWASTDGGANLTRQCSGGYWEYKVALSGYSGVLRVLKG